MVIWRSRQKKTKKLCVVVWFLASIQTLSKDSWYNASLCIFGTVFEKLLKIQNPVPGIRMLLPFKFQTLNSDVRIFRLTVLASFLTGRRASHERDFQKLLFLGTKTSSIRIRSVLCPKSSRFQTTEWRQPWRQLQPFSVECRWEKSNPLEEKDSPRL